MLINRKHVKNPDLLDRNFHTVTEPLMLKLPIEYIHNDFKKI